MFKKTYLDIISKNIDKEPIFKKEGTLISFLFKKSFFFLKKRYKEVLILGLVFVCIVGGGWYYKNSVNAPKGNIFSLQEVKAITEEERVKLQKELAEIDAQIAKYEKELSTTQTEKATLQNAINTLKKKASSISLQIKSSQGTITQLKGRIQDTEIAINQTISSIEKTKQEVSLLLQTLYQYSSTSDLEILLSDTNFQDYFDKTNNLNILQDKIKEKLVEMKVLKGTLTGQKQTLDDKKEDTQKVLSMQLLQQQELERNKKEQENLLTVTKGKEATYQQVLSEARKKAAEIRSRIYELVGVTSKVTFGQALDIANWISAKTGIRPAFILAVLTQESNLGGNVGTCNRPGDPPNKSYKVIMKPSRDQVPFERITKDLGMDPNSTPVSCPMYTKGVQVGWGGAMGPAQFIPSTWIGYENKISSITGRSPANPWNITDAFTAAALYLTDKGAGKQTYDAEWRAAMIYFAGTVNNTYRFYGDNVMAIAKRYEADIATIKSAKN